MGPVHCPMISKYGPSLSNAVGPVDLYFLVVKNLILIKYSSYRESTNSVKQKLHVGLSKQLNLSQAAPQKR